MKTSPQSALAWMVVTGLLFPVTGVDAGEKIEFTSPTKSAPFVKPLTEKDLGERTFNFQKGSSAESEMSAPLPLPSGDQAARAKIFLELMERNGAYNPYGEKDAGLSLNPPEAEDPGFGIDGLFEQQESAPARRPDRRNDNDSPFGLRRPDRESATPGNDSSNDIWSGGSSSDSNGDWTGTSGLFGPSERRRDNDSSVGPRREPERTPSFGLTEPAWLKRAMGNGGEEQSESRSKDGRADFRRLLGTSTQGKAATPDANLTGVTSPAFGAPPVDPNMARAGAANSPAGLPTMLPPGSDPLAANRLAVSGRRPLDFGASAVGGGGSAGTARVGKTPDPTPMELFRQKHDTKVPSRVF